MANERDISEIRKEINSHLDQITNSAEKILSAFDDSVSESFIDAEMIKIFSALKKIGIASGKSKKIEKLIKPRFELFKELKQFSGDKKELRLAYLWFLNQICSIPSDIKKDKKYHITISLKLYSILDLKVDFENH